MFGETCRTRDLCCASRLSVLGHTQPSSSYQSVVGTNDFARHRELGVLEADTRMCRLLSVRPRADTERKPDLQSRLLLGRDILVRSRKTNQRRIEIMTIQLGDTAPDFSADTTEGRLSL